MACGDLASDAIGPLRTLLSITRMLCATVRDLIEAASMACGELPPKERGALRTLLRVASGKLDEARNDTAAVADLSGRPFGLEIERVRGAANARPPAAWRVSAGRGFEGDEE